VSLVEVLATCHVHSDWSYDGRFSLKDLSEKFSHRGSRILLMTEHDRGFTTRRFEEYREACAEASSDKILVIPGIEYSDPANRVHVLVWGVPFLGEGLPTGEMLEAVHSAEGAAVLAHPSRRGVWQDFERQWADRLIGVEVWNRKYDGWAPSGHAPKLLQTKKSIPFVGLDFHTDRQLFPLSMALDLPGIVTEDEVLKCLRAGRLSARAFGLPLDHNLLRRTVAALGIAEQGRRKLASIVNHSRGQTR
jgi:hypothetical protein